MKKYEYGQIINTNIDGDGLVYAQLVAQLDSVIDI